MEKVRFLLSVVFYLHRLNTWDCTRYSIQEEYCHRSGLIEVDRENIDGLGELIDSKLHSMAQGLNATLEAKNFVVIGARKLPDALYLPTSHSLVTI